MLKVELVIEMIQIVESYGIIIQKGDVVMDEEPWQGVLVAVAHVHQLSSIVPQLQVLCKYPNLCLFVQRLGGT